MPKKQDSVGISPQEARSVHNICTSLQDRLQQIDVFPWVVFQIRILNQHVIACGGRNSGVQGSALSPVFRVAQQLNRIGMAYATYSTTDLDGDYAYLQSKGVEFVSAPATAPNGERFVFFFDPDGIKVQIAGPRTN